MNYFAHGYRFVDDPYFLVGTAIPDWMDVVDRRVRIRRQTAVRMAQEIHGPMAAVARGVVQHIDDDAWFHRTRAFCELSWQFARWLREIVEQDESMRPSFLGHILVEILLDATLIAERPDVLDAYYAAVSNVEPSTVEGAVARLSRRAPGPWGHLIPRFVDERFLEDYLEDRPLLRRLNQVMQRVGLPRLHDGFLGILPRAREAVCSRQGELLLCGDRT